MNKMKEYERGREDGLDLALRIVRDGGIEALERKIKFRGITGVHTSLASKDLDKAAQKIKEMTLDKSLELPFCMMISDLDRNAARSLWTAWTRELSILRTIWRHGRIISTVSRNSWEWIWRLDGIIEEKMRC